MSRRIALAVIGVQVAEPQVAIDAVGFDQPVQVRARPECKIPQPARIRQADALLEPFLIAPHANVSLTAVAPGSAPAETGLLEQYHVDSAARQVQRRGQPGVAATDDADLSACRTREWFSGKLLLEGRRII